MPCCSVCWLSIRPSSIGSSFLIHEDRFPLTKFQFASVVRKCLGVVGLSGYHFTSHFFCISAATKADRLGLGDSVIHKIGDRADRDRVDSINVISNSSLTVFLRSLELCGLDYWPLFHILDP